MMYLCLDTLPVDSVHPLLDLIQVDPPLASILYELALLHNIVVPIELDLLAPPPVPSLTHFGNCGLLFMLEVGALRVVVRDWLVWREERVLGVKVEEELLSFGFALCQKGLVPLCENLIDKVHGLVINSA